MKRLLFALTIAAAVLSGAATANGRPPPWAPAWGYRSHLYYPYGGYDRGYVARPYYYNYGPGSYYYGYYGPAYRFYDPWIW
jgi:hypothetical protein